MAAAEAETFLFFLLAIAEEAKEAWEEVIIARRPLQLARGAERRRATAEEGHDGDERAAAAVAAEEKAAFREDASPP